jgi:Mlc titration factor MtfA (ptsG expression regulator)
MALDWCIASARPVRAKLAAGPIVLNWLDIQDSFDASGFNLIIHEVAHKLDTRNGDRANGIPLIPLREVAAGSMTCMRNGKHSG